MTAEIQAVSSAVFDAALDYAILLALKGSPLIVKGEPYLDEDGLPFIVPPDAAILAVAEKRAKSKRGTTQMDADDALAEAQKQHEAAMEARKVGNPDGPPETAGDENIR